MRVTAFRRVSGAWIMNTEVEGRTGLDQSTAQLSRPVSRESEELRLVYVLASKVSLADAVAVLNDRRERLGTDLIRLAIDDVEKMGAAMGVQFQRSDAAWISVVQAGRLAPAKHLVARAVECGQLTANLVQGVAIVRVRDWRVWMSRRNVAAPEFVALEDIAPMLGTSAKALRRHAVAGYLHSADLLLGRDDDRRPTWHIHRVELDQLCDLYEAGRPLPWEVGARREATVGAYKRWLIVKHPAWCSRCRSIWSSVGEPTSVEQFSACYEALKPEDRLHLGHARPSTLLLSELSEFTGQQQSTIQEAVNNGQLRVVKVHGAPVVTHANALRWAASNFDCGKRSDRCIEVSRAASRYGFDEDTLASMMRSGEIRWRLGMGSSRGRKMLYQEDCERLASARGISTDHAMKSLGVTAARLCELLGLKELPAAAITADAFNAARERLHADRLWTTKFAAWELRVELGWVRRLVETGQVVLTVDPDAPRHCYFAQAQQQRLSALIVSEHPTRTGEELTLEAAAHEGRVSVATVAKWRRAGRLESFICSNGTPRLTRASVRAAARAFWQEKLSRASIDLPSWLIAERRGQED